MTEERIIKEAWFQKIKDMNFLYEDTIKQFIKKVVYKHPNCLVLLKNFSDIYVLVASFSSQTLLKPGEKSWKEIMNKKQYDLLEKNGTLVIAYMLANEKYENIHYIDLFDTVVRNNNLGYHMINRYEKERDYKVRLIPQYIIITAAKYWAKILGLLDDRCIVQKNLIDEFIENNNIKPKDISWKHLYNFCGKDKPVKYEWDEDNSDED